MKQKKNKTIEYSAFQSLAPIDYEFFFKESQIVGDFGFYTLNFLQDNWTSSEALDTLLGIDHAAEKTISSWSNLIHPQQKEEMLDYFYNTVIAEKKQFNKEYKIIRKNDGAERWVWGKGELEFDTLNNPVRMIGTIQDITERKRLEEEMKRLNRVNEVTSQINQMVVRTSDIAVLFSEACNIATTYGKFRMAWIGLVDEHTYTVKPIAVSGFEDGYLDAMKTIAIGNGPEGKGPTGSAIMGGEVYHCNDIATDPAMIPWREEALKRGYKSSISLPFIIQGKTIGAFNIYASESHFFNEKEIQSLSEVVNNISLVLEKNEVENNRLVAEEELRKSEENFHAIFQNASDGIFIADRQGQYTNVNISGLKMLGYSKGEILQLNLRNLIPPEELELTLLNFAKLNEGEPISAEHCLICKDGKLLPVEISASILPNGSLLGMVRDISERKEAELEKDYLLSFNKRLVENSPIGTLLYKVSSGQCVLANNAAKIAIGGPIEKILSQNFWEMPSWKESNLLENAKQVIETEVSRKFTAHFTTSFGRNVWLDCQMVSIFLEGEKHLLLTITDITERSMAEEALIESEEKFRTIFEQGSDGILLAELDAKKFLMGNKMICQMLGYDSNEITNLSVADIHPEENLPKVIDAFEKQLRKEIHIATNLPVKRKDGSVFFADINSSPVIIKGKKYLFGVFRDITERKQAEDKLRVSEERYKSIVDLAADGIALGSPKGIIIGANQQICQITGYSDKELVGSSISVLFSEGQLKNSPLRYDLLDLGIIVRNERIITRKDGSFVPIEMNTKKMPDNTYQTIIRDITERLKSEELKRKIEKTEYENKVKSKFMANLSHEIRNPLNAIIGHNSLIAKDALSPDQKKSCNAIKVSSENLLEILNEILDFSKIEANKIEFHDSNFNLRKMAEEAILLYEAKAIEKGITLNIFVSEDIPEFVKTDHTKLKQILNNLLGNAIKFTEQGKVELVLKLTHKENKHITIEFTVKDTGIGIEQNDFEKIFQSFTQLDSSTKKIYPGTGLGLSICKSYVELLGGTITVKSNVGTGSEFSFSIPLKIAKSAEQEETVIPIATILQPEQIRDKQFAILVVEDDAINRLYLTRLLKSQNFNVEGAGNGSAALELFMEKKYDLVIMDCQMPKMDGFEAAQRIREFERENNLPQIPIIAFSGYSLNDISENFRKAEMNDYMIKPINEAELFNKIMALTEKNK